MSIQIVDQNGDTKPVDPGAPFKLPGGQYVFDVSGEFAPGALIDLQSTDATVQSFAQPGHFLVQLDPGTYRVSIGRVRHPEVMIHSHAQSHKRFAQGGHSAATHPARMNDATFVPGWLDRHGFSFTPAYQDWRGTLSPEAAAEVIDRHLPPLAVTPANIDAAYTPHGGAAVQLTLSRGGHVLNGATDLAHAAAGHTVQAIVIVED
jgi:hypothetical protein